VFDRQQTVFAQSLPFDYAERTMFLPSMVSPPSPPPRTAIGNVSLDPYLSNPISLQYIPDGRVTPHEKEEDEVGKEEGKIAEPPVEPTPKRKRGRPRLDRRMSEGNSPKVVSQRVPHKQVERKYRQMLNTEMERLRANVPTLPQHNGDFLTKPSKSTILSAAVDYIKILEAEAGRLTQENEELKHMLIG